MSRYLLVPKDKAEEARLVLQQKGVLDSGRKILEDDEGILLPLSSTPENLEGTVVEREDIFLNRKPQSLHGALQGILSDDELRELPSSFDVVGDIAVLELPESLREKREVVGERLLDTFPSIKVAAVKSSPVGTVLRTRQVEVVAGEHRTETVHREFGCSYRVDVADTYFSPRSGTERNRVARLVKAGERVLVLFAGVGPFAVLIKRLQPKADVISVELNPKAVGFMRENVRVNKVNVRVVEGDARTETLKLGLFDRIIMPLPKDAGDFLDVVFPALKEGGVVHFYGFARDTKELEERVRELGREHNRELEILDSVECGSYNPMLSRICVDFTVKKTT